MAKTIQKPTKEERAHFAVIKSWNLPISRKFSVEIGNYIRFKKLETAKEILQKTIDKKSPIPFKRYNRDLGHKRGTAAARFPIRASSEILKLLNSLKANAENKSLDTSNLIITEFMANKGNTMWHYGRKRRRQMKRCHLFIKVEEKETKK